MVGEDGEEEHHGGVSTWKRKWLTGSLELDRLEPRFNLRRHAPSDPHSPKDSNTPQIASFNITLVHYFSFSFFSCKS